MKTKFLAITIFVVAYAFFPQAIWAYDVHHCSRQPIEKNIYISKQNIFSNGTEIIVRVDDKLIEVPFLQNAHNGKGFFIDKNILTNAIGNILAKAKEEYTSVGVVSSFPLMKN